VRRGSLARLAREHAFGLLVAGVFVGGALVAIQREQASVAERLALEEAQHAARAAVLARGRLDEMLAACRAAWVPENGFDHDPVAVAWTRASVTAYVYQGSDAASLRQLLCDPRGVRRGPRVGHPLAGLLPAEATVQQEAATYGEWAQTLAGLSARSFSDGEVAFEVLLDLATSTTLTRSWRETDGAVVATPAPADAPAFALLVFDATLQKRLRGAPAPVRPLPRRDWAAEPAAAFALLARELPKGARVSELKLDDDELDATIDWPTPAFEGKPTAPYGSKSWDEYGIPDTDWWYPYTEPGFGCPRGESLPEVRAAFDEALAQKGAGSLLSAWYSCSPAYSDGRRGVWRLVPTG
jgi:hypothetical protein